VKERGREKLGRAGLMGRKRELDHAVNTGRMRERGSKKASGCCLGSKKGGGPHGKEKKRSGKKRGGPAGGWVARAVGEREREEWVGGFIFFKYFFKLSKV
jgi:hypothetical protein